MTLQSNDFELFGVPVQFVQSDSELNRRWQELQRRWHPDQFVAQGDAALRTATQWSVRINEAHARLKKPLRRAAYLCELHGSPIQAHTNTAMPVEFMLQQMQCREDLEEATDLCTFEALRFTTQQQEYQHLKSLSDALDKEKNFIAAANQVRALMFIEKFLHEVEDKISTFD